MTQAYKYREKLINIYKKICHLIPDSRINAKPIDVILKSCRPINNIHIIKGLDLLQILL